MPPSQHARRFGGARLPVPAASQRHAAGRLQRGLDVFAFKVFESRDLLFSFISTVSDFVTNCVFVFLNLCQDLMFVESV